MYSKLKNIGFVECFILTAILAMGLFHEFLSCIAGMVLCVYICVYSCKNKKLSFNLNISSVAILLICLFYCLSCFWAIDKGSAVVGIFKFMPLLLFLIVLMQQDKEGIEFLNNLPLVASVMTVVSTILMQFDSLRELFSIAGRLAGFFQYSNTFALFLLISIIILVTKEKHSIVDFVMLPILLFGIIYSGSRTVFVLMIVTVFVLIIFGKNKKLKLALVITVAVGIIAALVYTLVTDKFYSIGRFLTISLTESTFVGRFLYFYDALPVIIRHPFGMGYLGYYYFQHSVQSGIYTVRFIHNDFLQLLLDIGWIPVAIFVVAILKSFFKKGTTLRKRLLMLIVCAHTCFDFNFQYVAIFMLFIMLLDYKDGKKYELSLSKIANILLTSILSFTFVYMGITHALCEFRQHELSNKIYPWYTQNHIAMLTDSDDFEVIENLADTIIENNEYVSIAYNAKARCAYMRGEFVTVIKYMDKAIEKSHFTKETYDDYCQMLLNGVYLYTQAGDDYSAQICAKKYHEVKEKLASNSEKLSALGKRIKQQPETELSKEILNYAEELGI